MRFTVLLFALLITWAAEAGAARRIWIDSDPAIGAPWREVDDAFALVLAFHSPEVRIIGISTTYGNAALARTTAVTRNLVRRFGGAAGLAEENVHPGAESPQRSGSDATEALAEALRKESLTYIALGPLTNLAAFLEVHPILASRIDRVIFVGGRSAGRALRFGPTGALRIHDANVFKDPAAVRTLLRSKIPVSLAPVETSSRLILEREDFRRLKESGAAGQYLHRKSRVWFWFWTDLVKEPGGPVFDALAVVLATRPELVVRQTRSALVDEGGDLIAPRRLLRGSRPVDFCAGLGENARRFLLSRLSTRPQHSRKR